jgi:hypothetical protein
MAEETGNRRPATGNRQSSMRLAIREAGELAAILGASARIARARR